MATLWKTYMRLVWLYPFTPSAHKTADVVYRITKPKIRTLSDRDMLLYAWHSQSIEVIHKPRVHALKNNGGLELFAVIRRDIISDQQGDIILLYTQLTKLKTLVWKSTLKNAYCWSYESKQTVRNICILAKKSSRTNVWKKQIKWSQKWGCKKKKRLSWSRTVNCKKAAKNTFFRSEAEVGSEPAKVVRKNVFP